MSTLSMQINVNTRANQQQINSLRNSFQSLTQSARQLAGISIGQNLIQEIRQANSEFQSFERSLNAIKGVGAGTLEFDRLAGLADKLGLSISSLSQSYKTFNASAAGTSLEGFKAAQGFEALAGALSVVGANSDASRRAFTAVAQMISKGQVYAEELKGQLAENLPGAIGIFARGLGVTQSELLNLVKAGKVGLPELEKFFKQLTLETGKAAASLSNPTLEQSIERLKTQFNLLYIQIGQSGVWQLLTQNVNAATNTLRSFTSTANGISSAQASFIALQQVIVSWGSTFQQTFQEADAALNGFLTDFNNNVGGGVDLGTAILQSLADLPANLKALVTIVVGELGKGAIEIGRLFDQQWLSVQASADNAFLGIRVAFQTVVASIQTMLGTLAGSMASSLEKLGKSGEFIPGFRSSINEVAQGLRAVEAGAAAGAAKLDTLKSKQDSLKQSYRDSQKAIDAAAQAQKDSWDGVIQNAIDAANSTSQQRKELTAQLQAYKEIDQSEQRLWAIRMENLRATQSQYQAIRLNNIALQDTKSIFNSIKDAENEIQRIQNKSKSVGKLSKEAADALLIAQQKRKDIAKATTDAEKKSAGEAYAAALKAAESAAMNIQSSKNVALADRKRLEALKAIAAERERLNAMGITEPNATAKVDADTSSAMASYRTLKTEIEGSPAVSIIKANDDSARETVVGMIKWIESQEAELTVNVKQVGANGGFNNKGTTSSNEYVDQYVPKFHTGGILGGYGGGDRIRALLEPGEGILNKETVRYLGADTIMALNRMHGKGVPIPKVNSAANIHIPRFASGGVAVGTMNHVIHIGGNKHQLSGSRDSVAGLVKDLNKIGRSL